MSFYIRFRQVIKTKDVQQVIKEHLHELGHKRGLKILLAVESGSRAWGFPSPDSDYDVRIIYQRPIDWYLSIENHKDTIEYFHGDLLDINGWDIRKTLSLLRKSNATPFEWAQSPVIYQEEAGFRAQLLDLARRYFQPVHALNHYQGIARKSYQAAQEDGKIKLKKLFYVIRPLLAARWILEKESIPPMAVSPLLTILEDGTMKEHILHLIELKRTAGEDYVHPVPPLIRDYIEEQFRLIAEARSMTKRETPPADSLNDFFKKLLGYQ